MEEIIEGLINEYKELITELLKLDQKNVTSPDHIRVQTRIDTYIVFKKQLESILASKIDEIKPNHALSKDAWDKHIVKCWDKFDNQIVHNDLVSVCREFECVVLTGEDGQLYLTNPLGKKVPVSSYYSMDLVVVLREGAKISNRPKVIIPILPAQIEPVSDFLWINQFGKGDEKDRRGRWAIQCLYHGTLIATITRVDHIDYGRFYSTKDFFPSSKSNNPCRDVSQEKETDIKKIIAAVEERFKSFINPK